jgi:hypothetical protein
MMAYDVSMRAQRLTDAREYLRGAIEEVCIGSDGGLARMLAQACSPENGLPPIYGTYLDSIGFLLAVRGSGVLEEVSQVRKSCLREVYRTAQGDAHCEDRIPPEILAALGDELSANTGR